MLRQRTIQLTAAPLEVRSTAQIDLIVITTELLRPAVRRIGAFKVSAAPRKLPTTIEQLSNQTGFPPLEVRKFIHDNSFAFQMMLYEERQELVNQDVAAGLSAKQIATTHNLSISAVYPHYNHAIDLRKSPAKDETPITTNSVVSAPAKIAVRNFLSFEDVVDAVIAVGPFCCSHPPKYPTDGYIAKVCLKLGKPSRDLYGLFIGTGQDIVDVIRAARAKFLVSIKAECLESGQDPVDLVSVRCGVCKATARIYLSRYSPKE